jgi:hypothetical protein
MNIERMKWVEDSVTVEAEKRSSLATKLMFQYNGEPGALYILITPQGLLVQVTQDNRR